MSRIAIIVALGRETRAIGKKDGLLWHIPEDLKRFKTLTIGHPVIMGRKTWESLPEKVRPLPDRTNIVVTRQADYAAVGAIVVGSLEDALAAAAAAALPDGRIDGADEIFVIGGGEIYKDTLPLADRLYLTLVDDNADGDTYFPAYEDQFTKTISEEAREHDGLAYRWLTLERK